MKTSSRVLLALALATLVVASFVKSARAQNNSLCTPFTNAAGNRSCIVVGMTGAGVAPYTYNWLPVGGLANAAAPTYTEGRLSGLSFDLSGNLRVSSGAGGGATAANQTATQAPVAPAAATAIKSELTGCQATDVAVSPTTGQQTATRCDTNNNLLTSSGGAPNLAIAQVTVTTSDTSVATARALRRSITVQNITGTQDVFCNQTTATAANGILLTGRGSSFTFNTTSAVRCISITASQTVGVAETF